MLRWRLYVSHDTETVVHGEPSFMGSLVAACLSEFFKFESARQSFAQHVLIIFVWYLLTDRDLFSASLQGWLIMVDPCWVFGNDWDMAFVCVYGRSGVGHMLLMEPKGSRGEATRATEEPWSYGATRADRAERTTEPEL